jgi:selT/selW/selH-like putative selenoprotein
VTPGSRGQFDVVLDGRVLFSKQAKGHFPEDDEVLSLLT